MEKEQLIINEGLSICKYLFIYFFNLEVQKNVSLYVPKRVHSSK